MKEFIWVIKPTVDNHKEVTFEGASSIKPSFSKAFSSIIYKFKKLTTPEERQQTIIVTIEVKD